MDVFVVNPASVITALPGNLIRYKALLPDGDPSDTAFVGIIDEIVLPPVATNAATGARLPGRSTPLAPRGNPRSIWPA